MRTAALPLLGCYVVPQAKRGQDRLHPGLHFGGVDPVGESLPATAPVLHPRVHREHGVRVVGEHGTAGVTEAGANPATAGV